MRVVVVYIRRMTGCVHRSQSLTHVPMFSDGNICALLKDRFWQTAAESLAIPFGRERPVAARLARWNRTFADFADRSMAVIDRKNVVSAAALPFETISVDLNPAQTATEPKPQLHKQKTPGHAQHQVDEGARLLGRVGQHLVGPPDK